MLFRRLLALFSGQAARQGYLAAVDQGVISAANFLATVLLARSATPTDLGIYGVGFITLHLARSIQEGIVIQPMNVLGAAMTTEKFRSYATSTSLIQLCLALVSALSVGLCGWLLTSMGNDVAGPALAVLWFSFLTWQLQEYLRRMLYTRAALFSAALNTLLSNTVRLGLMAFWAARGALDGYASLEAIGWGALAALLPGLWATRHFWTRKPFNLFDTWKRNWEFGRWVLGGTLANWLAVEAYPILTAGMISFAAAGAYRALQNLVAPIHLLLRAADTFMTPRTARLYQHGGRRAVNRTIRLTYLMVGIPILGLLGLALVFPEPLLRLLYGETYLPYSRGMGLMALFYALLYAYWPLQTALKAARLSRPIFSANLAAALCMFTLGIWAISNWGVYGTIAGQALNALVMNVVLWSAWRALDRG